MSTPHNRAEKGDFAEYEPGKPYEPVEEPVVTVMN